MSYKLPVIKLDQTPADKPKANKEDLNPNKKLGFENSQTRSESFRVRIQKQESSSESSEIRKVKEELADC